MIARHSEDSSSGNQKDDSTVEEPPVKKRAAKKPKPLIKVIDRVVEKTVTKTVSVAPDVDIKPEPKPTISPSSVEHKKITGESTKGTDESKSIPDIKKIANQDAKVVMAKKTAPDECNKPTDLCKKIPEDTKEELETMANKFVAEILKKRLPGHVLAVRNGKIQIAPVNKVSAEHIDGQAEPETNSEVKSIVATDSKKGGTVVKGKPTITPNSTATKKSMPISAKGKKALKKMTNATPKQKLNENAGTANDNGNNDSATAEPPTNTKYDSLTENALSELEKSLADENSLDMNLVDKAIDALNHDKDQGETEQPPTDISSLLSTSNKSNLVGDSTSDEMYRESNIPRYGATRPNGMNGREGSKAEKYKDRLLNALMMFIMKDQRSDEDIVKVLKLVKMVKAYKQESPSVSTATMLPESRYDFDEDSLPATQSVNSVNWDIKRPSDKKVGVMDRSVGAMDRSVGVMDNNVGVMDRSVGAMDRSVGAMDRSVGVMDRSIGVMDKKAIAKDKKIAAKDKKIAAKDKKIAAKDKKVIAKDKKVIAKDKKTIAKDKKVIAKDKKTIAKDKKATAKDKKITAKDKKVTTKDKMVIAKDKKANHKQVDKSKVKPTTTKSIGKLGPVDPKASQWGSDKKKGHQDNIMNYTDREKEQMTIEDSLSEEEPPTMSIGPTASRSVQATAFGGQMNPEPMPGRQYEDGMDSFSEYARNNQANGGEYLPKSINHEYNPESNAEESSAAPEVQISPRKRRPAVSKAIREDRGKGDSVQTVTVTRNVVSTVFKDPVQSGIQPSGQPSIQPSVQPSVQPGVQSVQPSIQPSIQPGTQPSVQPSIQPGIQPSVQPPSVQPNIQSTVQPSAQSGTQPVQQGIQPNIQVSRNNPPEVLVALPIIQSGTPPTIAQNNKSLDKAIPRLVESSPTPQTQQVLQSYEVQIPVISETSGTSDGKLCSAPGARPTKGRTDGCRWVPSIVEDTKSDKATLAQPNIETQKPCTGRKKKRLKSAELTVETLDGSGQKLINMDLPIEQLASILKSIPED